MGRIRLAAVRILRIFFAVCVKFQFYLVVYDL